MLPLAANHLQGCVNNSTAGRKLVRFSFPAAFSGPRPSEQSVHLIGSFTGWQVRHALYRHWLAGWLPRHSSSSWAGWVFT